MSTVTVSSSLKPKMGVAVLVASSLWCMMFGCAVGENNSFYRFYQQSIAVHEDVAFGNPNEFMKFIDLNKSTLAYIHGWRESCDNASSISLCSAFLRVGNHNVICVDWSSMSFLDYLEAAGKTKIVGKLFADDISATYQLGFAEKGPRLVGFSLGAQIAGFFSKNLVALGHPLLREITGLDPAFPGFYPPTCIFCGNQHLQDTDAEVVAVMHADAGVFGTPYKVGRYDFYPNRGTRIQKGCPIYPSNVTEIQQIMPTYRCSHDRSWMYYWEAISDIGSHVGLKCDSWGLFLANMCPGNITISIELFMSSDLLDSERKFTSISLYSKNRDACIVQLATITSRVLLRRELHDRFHFHCTDKASTPMNMALEKIVRSFKFDEVAIYDDDKSEVDIIKEIIESREQEDAFYILDVADVIDKHKTWMSKLPKVEPFYAVKCNPHPTVVKVLASLNAGFDCASKREIQMVMEVGVPADRIIFAHTIKHNSHIKFARECGVKMLTADGEFELEKIKIIYPEAQVVIRFRCDAKLTVRVLGEKFGCESEIESRTLIRKAKDLGLNVHGFSFHVGTECEDSDAFNRGIKIAEELIEYAKSLGLQNVRLIDIGGGLSGLRNNSLDKFVATTKDMIEGVDSSTRIISEPGRFFVTSACTLLSLIHGKRITRKSGLDHHMYFTNDGIYGSFNEVLFGKKMPSPIPLEPPTKADTNSSSFWGPSCDSFDCIIRECQYTELNPGDWVMWPNMGDYALSVAGTFNGFHPPIVFPIIKRSQWDSFRAECSVHQSSNN